jgi:hypothetical protein
MRYAHAFITATDGGGTEYFAAFPKEDGPSMGFSGDLSSGGTGAASHMSGRSCGSSESSRNFAFGSYGVLSPRVGSYTLDVAPSDFAPAGAYPGIVVVDDDQSCTAYNEALADAITRIGQSNIPYDILYNNSHAAVWTTLESAGLRPGRSPMWAPARELTS